MRHADGFDPRRRAADALGDREDRRGAGGAEEVHLSLHQRAALERKAASFQAQQILDVLRVRGYVPGAARHYRVAELRHGVRQSEVRELHGTQWLRSLGRGSYVQRPAWT